MREETAVREEIAVRGETAVGRGEGQMDKLVHLPLIHTCTCTNLTSIHLHTLTLSHTPSHLPQFLKFVDL